MRGSLRQHQHQANGVRAAILHSCPCVALWQEISSTGRIKSLEEFPGDQILGIHRVPSPKQHRLLPFEQVTESYYSKVKCKFAEATLPTFFLTFCMRSGQRRIEWKEVFIIQGIRLGLKWDHPIQLFAKTKEPSTASFPLFSLHFYSIVLFSSQDGVSVGLIDILTPPHHLS